MPTSTTAPQWGIAEIELLAMNPYDHPYTHAQVWMNFSHDSGLRLRRPAFWDGGSIWRVRFSSPLAEGTWKWRGCSHPDDMGFSKSGTLQAVPNPDAGRFAAHGPLKMSPGLRSCVHADDTPFLVVADTAWALPWRATPEQAEVFAADRQRKGFNAALLMSLQPDMKAVGPRDRTQPEGFDVAFEDLPDGKLKKLRPEYFQTLDTLVNILREHGIAPVFQPVFHGYGWKGLHVAGPGLSVDDYTRYCRYLVARYGAGAAIWLVGGDGSGLEPSIGPAGKEIQEWDCYKQPTGIHYGPNRGNNAHQDAVWLDFQWCQTGHTGEHRAERVAEMYHDQPIKAVANGEPTYENIGKTGRSAGWWQGHEAWSNLCAGATMGVVYGAGSLWQWKLSPDEPGHSDWCVAPDAGWREAMDFAGSTFFGMVGKILEGLPTTDLSFDRTSTYARRAFAVPGKLLVVYSEEGGDFPILNPDAPRTYRTIDAKTGQTLATGRLADGGNAMASVPAGGPRIVICCDESKQT